MLFIMFLVLIGLVYAALLVTYLLERRDRKKSAQRLAPLKRKKKNYSNIIYHNFHQSARRNKNCDTKNRRSPGNLYFGFERRSII